MSEDTTIQTAASLLRSRSRFTHVTESGQPYVLRRLNAESYISRGVFPPGVLYGSTEERQAVIDTLDFDKAEGVHRLITSTLAAGLLDPPVWDGEGECPETHVTLEDIPTKDSLELFDKLMEGAGLSIRLVRGAAFRPGESGAGEPDRPDRAEAGEVGAPGGGAEPGAVGV